MNDVSRRKLIKGIGQAIIAGASVPFIPRLISEEYVTQKFVSPAPFNGGRVIVASTPKRQLLVYHNGMLMQPGEDYIEFKGNQFDVPLVNSDLQFDVIQTEQTETTDIVRFKDLG